MLRKSLLCLMLLLLVGCTSDTDDMGIVARVNGAPIYLSQLEFQYDQFQSDTADAYVPSVEKLKAEYGEILSELIVQELVVQELQRQDLSVTEQEMLKAEEQVRADYPDGAFDQMLIEECIDLKAWRKQLGNYLAMRKFYHQVLRPQIKIDYKEAEDYYREHIADFYLPESLRILVVRGPSREIVESAVQKYLADKDQADLATVFGEVETREVVIREGRLSAEWKTALAGLKPGQSSGVLTDRFGFEALVLQERSPAKVLAPTQAYPLVEKALLEDKLRDAFAKWLTRAMSTAHISVSSHLLPSDQDEKAASPSSSDQGVGTTPDQDAGMQPDQGVGTTPDQDAGMQPDQDMGMPPDQESGMPPDQDAGMPPDGDKSEVPGEPATLPPDAVDDGNGTGI